MLWPYTLAMFVALLATVRTRGPMWAFAISWLVTVLPITLDFIVFDNLKDYQWYTTRTLLGTFFAFALGIATASLGSQFRASRTNVSVEWEGGTAFAGMLPYARYLWFVGAGATALYMMDYYLTGGANTTSLAELRENIVTRTTATVPGQISQLFGWANPIVFFFALYYRTRLTRPMFLWLVSAGVLHFVPGLLSAGRQSAFQLMVLSILALTLSRDSTPGSVRKGSPVLFIGIIAAAVSYMLYIAVARSEIWETRTKETILMALFHFRLSNWLDSILNLFPTSVRSSFVEGIVYFSHTPALFDNFLNLDGGARFWGANTFPFVMRRLTPITGISPEVAYEYKVALLDSVQAIGTGWSTAYSGLILDWGYTGLYISMFLIGLIAQRSWLALRGDPPFPVVMFNAIMLLIIIYLPTAIGIADTNILIATAVVMFAIRFRIGYPRAATAKAPATALLASSA